MFDIEPTPDFSSAALAPDAGPSAVGVLEDWKDQLSAITASLSDDAQRIDALRAMEELKCALEGEQAAITVDSDASQRALQARQGVPADRQARGIAVQVGLARRESGHRGERHLSLARRLCSDLPHTFAAMRQGRISEHKAQIVATETRCLSAEHRELVDGCLAGDPARIEQLGDRELEAECRQLAYRFDPQTFVNRAAHAVTDRRVTTRPAPDTMVYLTALLPVAQGVAAYAALRSYSVSANAAGDPRSRGQLEADRLVELLTGQATAEAVGIEVGVLLSDRTLVGLDDEPGTVRGYGPVPAEVARHLLLTAHRQGLAALRRLYACPTTGELVARDSRATRFPHGLADLIAARDQDRCRMPWCDAPIRDTDHAKARIEGGATSYANGQGLCEAHNIAKEAHGWKARPRPGPDGRHSITTTTPTGHAYTSAAPLVRVTRRPLTMEIYLAGDLAS